MTDYLILGGTGSLGQKLIDRLLPRYRLAVYSRDEAKHWTIKNDLACGPLAGRAKTDLRFYVGDVRDAARIREVIRQTRPRNVIFAAALKQVDTCELSPFESVQTNLLGVHHAVEAVVDTEGSVEHFLLISTDKCVSAVNTYGMCKAIAERLVTSQSRHDDATAFMAVRYGNVLESRGSIVPLFRHQAQNAECLTVTNPAMTRYLMTLDQSVDLILRTLEYGRSGETWIPRLPSMRVGDLAEIFAHRADKPVKVIGLRPGEKMHEDLVCASESSRTRKRDNDYVIGPAYEPGNGELFTYTSADNVLTKPELLDLLGRYGVIDRPLDQFPGAHIEEIAINQDGRSSS